LANSLSPKIGVPLSALEILTAQQSGGLDARKTLLAAASIAQSLEELGYHRVWYPEHHKSPYAGDFPPGIVIAYVAGKTERIRVGSGGVLAPNHVALSISEQFGALTALYPGRVDMGIGRGPGTLDAEVARVFRGGAGPASDEDYRSGVKAILRDSAERPDVPEPWLLASSVAGALLAAELGLPMAFAHHIRPGNATEAVARYRQAFTPSRWREEPSVMLCVQTVCADTDEAASALARPAWIWKAAAQTAGVDVALLDPATAADHVFSLKEEHVLEAFRPHAAEGSPNRVGEKLLEIVDAYDADELMLTTPIHDPKARLRSFELVARALGPTRD
jgi:luciferase family oxidoreductase group 1